MGGLGRNGLQLQAGSQLANQAVAILQLVRGLLQLLVLQLVRQLVRRQLVDWHRGAASSAHGGGGGGVGRALGV